VLSLTQFIAALSGALFAGAALYVSLVEHPARLSCGTRIAATQWVPSYKRAAVMQASLAIASFLAGVAAWWLGGGLRWLVGAVLIGLAVPYTLIVVKPTNDQLIDPARDPASAETRVLLERWGRLHAVRSGLSLLATLLYLDGWIR
jgi:glycerol uptake facilitator-like aquaporin